MAGVVRDSAFTRTQRDFCHNFRVADDPEIDPVHVELDLTPGHRTREFNLSSVALFEKLLWGNPRCEPPNYLKHSRCSGSKTDCFLRLSFGSV